MSEHKWPRPVAWEGWHATITGERPRGALPGFVDVQEYEANEPGRDYSMTPDEAEAHAHALIMAAAVARGEHGHTAALNRVAVALGAPFNRLTNPSPGDLRVLCDEWADMAQRIAGMVEAQLGVPLPRSLPPAVRTVVAERDTARAALAAVRDALGVVGNGSPVLAAESLREEADALREDLAAAEAARSEAVQESARLRVELSEAREALAGKTQHDTAAEVVAPLRDALKVGDLDPSTLSPADVVSHTLFRLGLRESAKPTREIMTHTSLASIEQHGVVVGDRLEWVSWPAAISLCEAVLRRGGLTVETQGGHRWPDVAVMMHNSDESWPLTVVEAPDAD